MVTCLVLSFVTNTSFKINLFHILKLDFGNDERRRIGDVISGDNLRKMLDIIQRNAIEDIRETDSRNSSISTESPICSAPPTTVNEIKERQTIEDKKENNECGGSSSIEDCSQQNALNSSIETIGDTVNENQKLVRIDDKMISNDGSGDTKVPVTNNFSEL